MFGLGGPMRPNVMLNMPAAGMPMTPNPPMTNPALRPTMPSPTPMQAPMGVMRQAAGMPQYPQSTAMPMQQPQMARQLTQALGAPPRPLAQ